MPQFGPQAALPPPRWDATLRTVKELGMRVSPRDALMVLAGGLYFGVVGTILGLIIFLWMYGVSRGSPLRFFPDPKDWGTAIVLAGMFGTPPAVATGLAAWPIHRYIRSALLLALALMLCGTAATAAYLMILGFELGRLPMQGFVIATGALTAFCCALPYAIWLRAPLTSARARMRAHE